MKINSTKIEMLLAEQDMTKKTLSDRCGVSRQNISTIVKRGTCEPRTAGRLALGLGVTIADIVEQEEL